MERDIRSSCQAIAADYDNWCEKEKTACLTRHHVATGSVAAQIVAKIAIPAAAVPLAASTGVSYITSLSSIEQFEQTVALGEAKAAAGEYGATLNLFSQARDGYHASFRRGHYVEVADAAIATATTDAAAQCDRHIAAGHLVAAHTLLVSLPRAAIVRDATAQAGVKAAEKKLATATRGGVEHLIDGIAQGGGHLDGKGKALLADLLTLRPHDYWLNFIKSKEQ